VEATGREFEPVAPAFVPTSLDLFMAETAKNANLHLTSGRLLARNTIWNLLGQIVPMVVALVTIPIIIRGMGVERFGVLSLAWIVVGYFSLFDLGIGRALTKFVADKLGLNEEHVIPRLAWTSLLLMVILGIAGALVTLALSPWFVHRLLRIPQALQAETLSGFYLLATSIPIVTTTAGLRGILEALQRFRIVNVIRIPMSIFSFVGPLLVLPFSNSLVPVVAALVAARLIGCGIHVWACFRAFPALFRSPSLDGSAIVPLIRFGGWLTVSNVVGPLMFYVDRFLVGALLSVSAIAYYTAPVDMVLRLTLVPGAVVGVLFPAFATSLNQDPARAGVLLSRGLKYVFLVVFPIVLVIVTFAPEGLGLWLGPTFSLNGASVLRWVAAGVFVNSLATLPFVLIQSAGRPDITAWLAAAELPVYCGALWFLTKWLGIEGTAIAWAGRLAVEATLLFFISERLVPLMPKFLSRLGIAVVGGLAVLLLGSLLQDLAVKIIFVSVALLAFGITAWFWGLAPKERDYLVRSRMIPSIGVRPN
jgi:O-antigen/teichoic acid export membrane protein